MNRLVDFWNEGSAELLRRTLEEHGVRVEDLAEKVGVTPRTVRNWMRTDAPPTRPYLRNLADLSAHLGLPVSAFRSAAAAATPQAAGTDEAEAAAPDRIAAHSTGVVPGLRDTVSAASPLEDPGHRPDRNPARRLLARLSSPRILTTAGVLAIIAAVIVVVALRVLPSIVSPPPVRGAFTFDIPSVVPGMYDYAFRGDVSPDGTLIAFSARDVRTKRRMLFVHSVIDRTTRVLPGSEGNYTSAFWDRDSRSLFFVTDADLMKVSMTGAPPERVGDAGEGFKGAVSADGTIVLGSLRGLLKITPGGRPQLLTKVGPGEVAHSLPSFLPNGDVLFTITASSGNGPVSREAAVYSFHSRAMRRLFPVSSYTRFLHEHLFYVRDDTLFARPFDPETLRFLGSERAIASPVWAHPLTAEAGFSASEDTLVLTPPTMETPPLQHVSPTGKVLATIAEPREIEFVAMARTSDALALIARSEKSSGRDIWLHPLDGRERVRLTTQPDPSSPVFARDDSVLYYASVGGSWANIYAVDVRATAAKPRPILTSPDVVAPRDVSPDGRFLLFQHWRIRDGSLWYMRIGDPTSARPFVETPAEEGESARFSPDGKRVAFVAKRGDEYSIYVTDFPPSGQLARRLVPMDGWRARWSGDGRHVYFVSGASVIEADAATGRTRRVYTANQEIGLFEPDRTGGFFVREVAVPPSRTVATAWWPRLSEKPLRIVPTS